MRSSVLRTGVVGALGMVTLLAPPMISDASARTFGVGTNPQGSLFYTIAVGISRVISTKTDLKFRVQPSAGTTTFLPLLNRGRLDFAVNNPIETTFARRGEEMFKGRPNRNLRVVAQLFPTYTGIIVRNDDKAKTIADLKGRSMPAEFTSQAIVQFMVRAYFANVGMSYKDFKPVPVANVVEGAREFMAGRVCCSLNLVGTAAIRQANATISGGVRFLSISKAPDAVKRMQAIAPGSYVRTLPPARPFVGVRSKTNFLAWNVLLITTKGVPNDVVYKVVKTLYSSKPNLVKIHPAFRGFNPKKMYGKNLEVPYHPGALKFFKEKGMIQ